MSTSTTTQLAAEDWQVPVLQLDRAIDCYRCYAVYDVGRRPWWYCRPW